MKAGMLSLRANLCTGRSGDDRWLRHDIDHTIAFLNRYYKDHGSVTFDAKADSRCWKAKKNWNSVGDHAPAYLINLYLATGEENYANVRYQHFPDYGYSPFMNKSSMTGPMI